ncbi:MAG: UDP-glucose 4-epimerase [Cycloclasticus pugetii]|jgi:UDP-glucose 4-epimerase|uniref:UDP-glucose 4-epimerase n=2 Tax=Cycloclasticus TaxID=34067 RepID=S5T6Z7_9GAMM|nr:MULTISPECIES: UDP-glucose 4-epimerase GalE [Cycloclasticus]AGS39294.1 UDP-glucose 4-epimerase [Cycloclasticus zancles 78-ME]ATI02914.1 UDP-glucose 4-epimerase GalE [Cycloclasticus sp. PY97N]EPD13665.1 UDP-glucose 4-epimerase [Cycloclasticus pugetii]
MTAKSILVTGGAGYIGSHVVKLLGERGENIIILDDLSTGFEHSILYGKFIQGNTGDKKLVDRILQQHNIDSVLHFAAHTIVPESVENPLKYYENNTCCTRNLLECCSKAGIENIIFSSTAAVYGELETGFASEETPTAPINPYGSSKLMSEQMIRDLSKATELNHVILRYFNVAGSDPDGKIGQSTKNATLLIKVAAEVAVGKREKLFVFGTDYPTPDGTGIRDYIHVSDLAEAHINALDYLRNNGESTTLNCGYGHGFSVKEVINAINEEHGVPICVEEMPRRAGDPPELISVAEKIRQTIGWQPQYDDLNLIVKTSLAWEKKLITHGS